MANSKLLVPFILKWEGCWANDPIDQGGATMKGVTIGTYTEYCRGKGRPAPTPEQLRNISEVEWQEIFKTMYWDRWQADRIVNQSIANILVDWVWASGVWGIKIPQRLLGVAQDGIVGPITLAALAAQDPAEFFARMHTARIEFVDDIVRRKPLQARFIKGWKNRINEFKFQK